MTNDEITRIAEKIWSAGESYIGPSIDSLARFAALVAAAEREACAEKTGEFARKWWSIHCASNKHMETTRKAHDDLCALQAVIRARIKA